MTAGRVGDPLSCYHRAGPLGQVIASLQAERPALRIGAVGLGAGAVAAYGRETDSVWFVEIDPAVVAIASDPSSFTYLADSAASIDVVVGDGRLEMAVIAPGGVIAVHISNRFLDLEPGRPRPGSSDSCPSSAPTNRWQS